MALVSITNASFGHDGKAILRDVSFSVNAGDYLCIIGENGSGKTTIMKTMLGLIPPAGGAVKFGGGLSINEIGYLPQTTDVQKDFPAYVSEIVLSGCLNRCGLRPFYSRGERAIAAANMEKLEISHLAKQCYRELSGGQQQRVLLARALCSTQKLLLLDEPAAGLDPHVTEEMYNIIQRLNHEDNITIVMISHDIKAIAGKASHILYVGSKAVFFGTKAEYFARIKSTGE